MKTINELIEMIKEMQNRALQDYFSIIFKDREWKNSFECIVRDGYKNSKKKSKYTSAYVDIRKYGIDNFTIKDMDVTLSTSFYQDIEDEKYRLSDLFDRAISEKVKFIAQDRNHLSHLNGNESNEEKIMMIYGSLNSLNYFIDAVCKTEADNESIDEYVKKYAKSIIEKISFVDNIYQSLKMEKAMRQDIKEYAGTSQEFKVFVAKIGAIGMVGGIYKSLESKFEYLSIAAEENVAMACAYLSDYYQSGFPPVSIDTIKAQELREKYKTLKEEWETKFLNKK